MVLEALLVAIVLTTLVREVFPILFLVFITCFLDCSIFCFLVVGVIPFSRSSFFQRPFSSSGC